MIIREKDRKKITALALETIKTPAEIWAFGSRVDGNAHDASDLDLVIVSNDHKKINIDEFISFKDSLRESNIPILVQVLDWNRIPESFHKNIEKNHEVLTQTGQVVAENLND